MTISDILKKEFTVQSLSLKHSPLSDFYTSQWQTSPEVTLVYLAYRVTVALIFSATLLLSVINSALYWAVAKWLLYVTNWGYTVCTLQAMLACYMVTRMMCMKPRERGADSSLDTTAVSPTLCAVYWALFNMAAANAFGITSIYWSVVHEPDVDSLSVVNITTHAGNSMMMLTDLFVVAHPVRLLHCYWPLLFGVVYVIFNVVFYLADGTTYNGRHYVYSILDWEKPATSTMFTVLVFVIVVFMHLLAFCMFLLRRLIHNRWKENQDNNA